MTPTLPPSVAWAILTLTAATLSLLLVFAAHRTHLLRLSKRSGPQEAREWKGELPRVTVQLPIYNEATVVRRLLDAAAALDYPRDRIQIQVLDDSTDTTSRYVAERVAFWRNQGVDMVHLHREERTGFKAGALARGMDTATGEFILILDADFVPAPSLIRDLLPPFTDPTVGMVQARWDHLNEEANLFTRCQALLLDAHFFFEQGGRYAGGRFMNFNGTAGMWRRTSLESAGGWSWDTLTEDLDLSYRCQMAGWRFVFLSEVGVPAEIPESASALEVQQKRWAQGGVQTGRKVLPRLLGGSWPLSIKLEGVVHLLGHLAYPLTLLLGVLLLPSAVARRSVGLEELLILDLVVFAGATGTFLVFYVAAGRRRKRPWSTLLPRSVATLALGIGLTAPCARAVLRGLGSSGRRDPFLRTPKRGGGSPLYARPSARGDQVLKGALSVWMIAGIGGAVVWDHLPSIPFLVLFAAGYTWLLLGDAVATRTGWREGARPATREAPGSIRRSTEVLPSTRRSEQPTGGG